MIGLWKIRLHLIWLYLITFKSRNDHVWIFNQFLAKGHATNKDFTSEAS